MSISRLLKKIKSWFSPKKRQQGTIKFFDRKKRFGFIIASENEYFFHAAAIRGLSLFTRWVASDFCFN